jgi:hypothetical protein
LVGRAVTVDGTVRFRIVCPPPSPNQAGCVAVGFLTDDGRDDVGTQPDQVGIRLYDGGQPVSCGASSLNGLSCKGWTQGSRYRVTGTVEHQKAGGAELPVLVLNASGRSARQ